METLVGLGTKLGPYGLAALGASLVGYGLLSGLLLVRRENRSYVRPYFVSTFLTSILCFVAAALERSTLSGELGAVVKLALGLMVLGHGLALLYRAGTRRLASRSLVAFAVVILIVNVLPLVPGLLGSFVNYHLHTEAAAHSAPEPARTILSQTKARMLTPLLAAGFGASFLALSSLLLLVRRARV